VKVTLCPKFEAFAGLAVSAVVVPAALMVWVRDAVLVALLVSPL
jgi:hypothetical protein